jgi:hypothetical protein
MTIKVWKDKRGNWITLSEFILRFKKGLKRVPDIVKLNKVKKQVGILDAKDKRR